LYRLYHNNREEVDSLLQRCRYAIEVCMGGLQLPHSENKVVNSQIIQAMREEIDECAAGFSRLANEVAQNNKKAPYFFKVQLESEFVYQNQIL
jgi:dipeptidase